MKKIKFKEKAQHRRCNSYSLVGRRRHSETLRNDLLAMVGHFRPTLGVGDCRRGNYRSVRYHCDRLHNLL